MVGGGLEDEEDIQEGEGWHTGTSGGAYQCTASGSRFHSWLPNGYLVAVRQNVVDLLDMGPPPNSGHARDADLGDSLGAELAKLPDSQPVSPYAVTLVVGERGYARVRLCCRSLLGPGPGFAGAASQKVHHHLPTQELELMLMKHNTASQLLGWQVVVNLSGGGICKAHVGVQQGPAVQAPCLAAKMDAAKIFHRKAHVVPDTGWLCVQLSSSLLAVFRIPSPAICHPAVPAQHGWHHAELDGCQVAQRGAEDGFLISHDQAQPLLPLQPCWGLKPASPACLGGHRAELRWDELWSGKVGNGNTRPRGAGRGGGQSTSNARRRRGGGRGGPVAHMSRTGRGSVE